MHFHLQIVCNSATNTVDFTVLLLNIFFRRDSQKSFQIKCQYYQTIAVPCVVNAVMYVQLYSHDPARTPGWMYRAASICIEHSR